LALGVEGLIAEIPELCGTLDRHHPRKRMIQRPGDGWMRAFAGTTAAVFGCPFSGQSRLRAPLGWRGAPIFRAFFQFGASFAPQ
jgi:hypothetical protein